MANFLGSFNFWNLRDRPHPTYHPNLFRGESSWYSWYYLFKRSSLLKALPPKVLLHSLLKYDLSHFCSETLAFYRASLWATIKSQQQKAAKENSHIRDTFTTFNTANPTKQPQLENFHSLTLEPFEVLPEGKISWDKGFTLNGVTTSVESMLNSHDKNCSFEHQVSGSHLPKIQNTHKKCYIVKVTNLQPTLHINDIYVFSHP